MSDRHRKPAIVTRFPPGMAAAAQAAASQDGMTMSDWMRKLVNEEVGRRGGKCPACGQPVPPAEVRHE